MKYPASCDIISMLTAVVLLVPGGCVMEDLDTSMTRDRQMTVDSVPLSCDSHRRCPKWMYCDERSDPRTCIPCVLCTLADLPADPQQCSAPVLCTKSWTNPGNDDQRLFCRAPRVVAGEPCYGLCHQLVTARGYALGTVCQLTCRRQTGDVTHAASCQFDVMAGTAAWNQSLPVGFTSTFSTAHSSPSALIQTTATTANEETKQAPADFPADGHELSVESVTHNAQHVITVTAIVLSVVMATVLVTALIIAVAALRHRNQKTSISSTPALLPEGSIAVADDSKTQLRRHPCEHEEEDVVDDDDMSMGPEEVESGGSSGYSTRATPAENDDSLPTTTIGRHHLAVPVENSETEEEQNCSAGTGNYALPIDSEDQFLLCSDSANAPSYSDRHYNSSSYRPCTDCSSSLYTPLSTSVYVDNETQFKIP